MCIRDRLVDGIIGGVIAVIGFLPLIMVLYFLLALLEDFGYMARVAVVLDLSLIHISYSPEFAAFAIGYILKSSRIPLRCV